MNKQSVILLGVLFLGCSGASEVRESDVRNWLDHRFVEFWEDDVFYTAPTGRGKGRGGDRIPVETTILALGPIVKENPQQSTVEFRYRSTYYDMRADKTVSDDLEATIVLTLGDNGEWAVTGASSNNTPILEAGWKLNVGFKDPLDSTSKADKLGRMGRNLVGVWRWDDGTFSKYSASGKVFFFVTGKRAALRWSLQDEKLMIFPPDGPEEDAIATMRIESLSDAEAIVAASPEGQGKVVGTRITP